MIKLTTVLILFKSIKHEVSMVEQKKVALNTFDDEKCYIDKCICEPWGYNPTS